MPGNIMITGFPFLTNTFEADGDVEQGEVLVFDDGKVETGDFQDEGPFAVALDGGENEEVVEVVRRGIVKVATDDDADINAGDLVIVANDNGEVTEFDDNRSSEEDISDDDTLENVVGEAYKDEEEDEVMVILNA